MSGTTVRIRPDQVKRPLPRLPHPSWRLSSPKARDEAPVSAEEFWQKLGL